MFFDQPAQLRAPQREDCGDGIHPEGLMARWLAAAFVLYGLLATALLAINMPPFQNPDEPNHFLRAAQVADGSLIGNRFPTTWADGSARIDAGGLADPAVLKAFWPFSPLMFHPERRVTRAAWEPQVAWSHTRTMQPFPNTAVYPPFFYAPSAIGVLVGQGLGLTVVRTLVVSRLLTGVAAVVVGAAAIACAGGAAVWLFAILTLPMSLALIASPAPDALMLACSALAGALLLRALRWPGGRDAAVLVGLVVTLGLVAMARPPYGALALLLLGLTRLRWRWRLSGAAAVAVGVIAWSAIAAATALVNAGVIAGADPAAQLALLRSDPLRIVHVASATLATYPVYVEQFIGRLGWVDTGLPPAYRTAATVMLGVAAVAAMLGLRGERIGIGCRLTIAAGLLLSAAGVFALQYLSWTVPGQVILDAVQGRYFLPLALAGVALLPALGGTRWPPRLHQALVMLVLAFPVVSLTVVMRTIVLRYYLQ